MSGAEAFRRGTLGGDSFAGVRNSARADAENAAFAAEVAKVMEQDGQISAGFRDIFKNAKGNYIVMFLGFVTGLIRGLELTAFALLMGWVFEGFQYATTDPGKMMHRMAMAVIAYGCSGFGCFASQFLSVSLITLLTSLIFLSLSPSFSQSSLRTWPFASVFNHSKACSTKTHLSSTIQHTPLEN